MWRQQHSGAVLHGVPVLNLWQLKQIFAVLQQLHLKQPDVVYKSLYLLPPISFIPKTILFIK